MSYVIGTAGHIDHGKTALVKALTGQDTDRLKEEKERGISIDLGFAHLDLSDGTRVGVVDVPGHERFIRNMLAGAHGIDLVLFTVAADDGVMPQTEEHLDIIHLLGIDSAVFVVTKSDLVSHARIGEVEEEIEILTEGTSLQGSPVVRVSSVTGDGLDELRATIAQKLTSRPKPPPSGYFRLPVDRVFVLAGHGVVVTGTAQSGEVHVGDHVRCAPGGQTFRARSVQVHNEAVATADTGQRVALNLVGPEKPAIERGDVICHEQLMMPTTRFDASLEVRPSAAKGISNHQRVRVHVGTAERLAKIILLGSVDIAPPKSTAVLPARPDGTRSGPARRSLHRARRDGAAHAGGRRRPPPLAAHVSTPRARPGREAPNAPLGRCRDRSRNVRRRQQGVWRGTRAALSVSQRSRRAGPGCRERSRRPDEDRARWRAGVYDPRKWHALQERVLATLHEFHAAHPLEAGRDLEELRARNRAGDDAEAVPVVHRTARTRERS